MTRKLQQMVGLATETADDSGDLAQISFSLIKLGTVDLLADVWIARELARLQGRSAALRGETRESCPEIGSDLYSQVLGNAWRVGFEDYRRERQDRLGCLASVEGHSCHASADVLADLVALDNEHPGTSSAARIAAERAVDRCASSDCVGILEEQVDDSKVLQLAYEKKANLVVVGASVQPKQHRLAL